MPEIILPTEILPEIDWNNPETVNLKGLLFCDGTNVIDLVSGVVSSTAPTAIGTDEHGTWWKGMVDFDLRNTQINQDDSSAYLWYIMCGRYNSSNSGSLATYALWTTNGNPSADNIKFTFDGTWSGRAPKISGSYASDNLDNSTYMGQANEYHSYALRLRLNRSGRTYIYTHNILDGTVGSVSNAAQAASANEKYLFRIGNNSFKTYVIPIYERVPGDESKIINVQANPYQLFKLINTGVEQVFDVFPIQWKQCVKVIDAHLKQQLSLSDIEQIIEVSEQQAAVNHVLSAAEIEQLTQVSFAQTTQKQDFSTQLIEQYTFVNTVNVDVKQQFTTQVIELLTQVYSLQLNAGAVYSTNPVEQYTYISRANIDVATVYSCQAIEYSFVASTNAINIQQQFTAQEIDYLTQVSAHKHHQGINFSTVAIEQITSVTTVQVYLGALPEVTEIDWDNVVLYSTTSQYKMISTTPHYILTRG